MKRKAKLIIILALISVAATTIYLYNPLASPNLDKLLATELHDMPDLHKTMDCEMLLNVSYAQIMHKYDNQWKHLEVQLRENGASEDEVRGVLKAARRHFDAYKKNDHYLYGVPVKAKLIRHRFRHGWIISFGWGCGCGSPDPRKGLTEPPTHVRVLAIEGRKPYRELGMQTCS